jgi:hypothetical protein
LAARLRIEVAKPNCSLRADMAIVIDGELASCCSNRGVDLEALRSAGLGRRD